MNEFGNEDAGGAVNIEDVATDLGVDLNDTVDNFMTDNQDLDVKAENNETEIKEDNENLSDLDKFLSEASEELNDDQPEDNNEVSESWLDEVNSLDLRDNGEGFEVQSKEHLQELLQKGHNFTQKTQALAQERKDFEAEMETKLAEFKEQEDYFTQNAESINTQIMENQIIEQAILKMQADDPDLFEEVKNYYRQAETGFTAQRNNPEVLKLQKEIQELKKGVDAEKSSYVMKQFDLEFEQASELLSDLKDTLGLEVDREVIKKEWATGKDVKKAIFSEYGDKILKLKNSKEKVNKVKQKKPVQALGGSRSRSTGKGGRNIDWSKDYDSIAEDIANFF